MVYCSIVIMRVVTPAFPTLVVAHGRLVMMMTSPLATFALPAFSREMFVTLVLAMFCDMPLMSAVFHSTVMVFFMPQFANISSLMISVVILRHRTRR
jgi:hypothetical protein